VPENLQAELEFAFRLADAADTITLPRFRATDLAVETKPDRTPVTEADRASERAIRDLVEAERPHHVVSGEEFGQVDAAPARWIVDPIDGTANYLRGVPVWATLLALELDGRLAVAVVSAPAMRFRWWATRGGGAFDSTGRQLHVSNVRALSDAHVLCSGDDLMAGIPGWETLRASVWRTRGFGDFWQHLLVAQGAAEFAIDPVVAEYDIAAPTLIVEEAGGRVSDLAGVQGIKQPAGYSSNGVLHDEILEILRRD